MPDTSVNSANVVEQWASQHYVEFVRKNPLKPLMGTSPNSVIQVKEELGKSPGEAITVSLVTKLTGAGVTDDNTLAGSEEALGNYGHKITVHQLRNGVVVGQYEKIKSQIDLWAAAKEMVGLWSMEKLRDLFIARLLSPVVDGLTTYSAASEAQKDAWCAANNPSTANQRILFGAAKSNSSGDHSADLAKLDTTNDDCHQDIIKLLKRMAQSCSPAIRPVTVVDNKGAGSEKFFCAMGSLPFRDLEANFASTLASAGERGESNQIFASGQLTIGNVVCFELPEMDRTPTNGGCLLENVGDSATTEVEPIFMLGAQALGLAYASRPEIIMDDWDYKNRRGVATAEIRGCEKLTFNSVQHGVATGYVTAAGD